MFDPNDLVLLDDQLTSYAPDLRKKPTRSRIKRTLEWASCHLDDDSFTACAGRVRGMFNKNEELGMWLRDLLLIEVQAPINGLSIPALYRINRNGYNTLLDIRKEIEGYEL